MTTDLVQAQINSDQVIEQFINSCSHDLRAPLTSIRGLVKVAEYYPQNEEVHNCFQMINNCTDTMDKLIRSLEEFMVVNHYLLSPETINCDLLIDNIISDFNSDLSSKSIKIHKKITSHTPMVTDLFIFSLIFTHLFKNAISFHDSRNHNKFVDVEIESKNNSIALKITDNGVGIPSTYSQKIFKPFFKASTQSQGTGMGLFLLNNLLRKVNGTISFRSDEKTGISFTVLLPTLSLPIAHHSPCLSI